MHLLFGKFLHERDEMALFTWGPKYSVGVDAIDRQHKGLVETLNELHAAMMKGQANTVTGPLLRKLANYTRDHFTAEERMMSSTQYPGLAQHRIKHQDLTRQVEEFVGRFERGEISVNVHLMNFLRDWLSTHILKEDHAYGPWMNQHGVH
jgi:hemerythrin-like metal-binding protein